MIIENLISNLTIQLNSRIFLLFWPIYKKECLEHSKIYIVVRVHAVFQLVCLYEQNIKVK